MNKNNVKIIAIDGPAASGKSTISNILAQKLNWSYVNTGILYRAIAYICRINNISLSDTPNILINIDKIISQIKWDPNTQELFYNNNKITNMLSGEQQGKDASIISKIPELRTKLIPLQRNLALQTNKTGVIVEGRDIGTVIFKDADLKIFLTASIDERALRRYNQLKNKNPNISFEIIKQELIARDKQDSERHVAPLKKSENAIELDTTNLKINEIINTIIQIMQQIKIL